MTNGEIYKIFDRIGCLTFSTVNPDNGNPESRIAHFVAYDKAGLYFTTMHTKPFYRQLTLTGKVSVCGMSAPTQVEEEGDGLKFKPGYMARLTGEVREVSYDRLRSKMNPVFDFCFQDYERYPATRVFVLHRGQGEIFDYDFEMSQRENKLERTFFGLGEESSTTSGLTIEKGRCIGCGRCKARCTF